MDVFILTCEQCNGEYGTETHISAHSSLELAQAAHLKVVDPEDIKIASTPEEPGREPPAYYNKWTDEYCYNETDTLKYQTGAWGYVVWKIKKLEMDVLPVKKEPEKCGSCGKPADPHAPTNICFDCWEKTMNEGEQNDA